MSDITTAPKDLTAKAGDIMRDVKAKASGLTDDVTRLAKDNVSRLGDVAGEMASNAKGQVESAVTKQRSIGADYLESVAQAAGRAAGEFDHELPQAAHIIRQASEQIQGVANTVRERDVRELVSEVQEFARRQPTLFFGGAILAGFAALRFLKSTAPQGGESTDAKSGAFDARREGH